MDWGWESKGCARQAWGMAVGIPGGCSSPWESQGCCKIEVAGFKAPRHQGWSENLPSLSATSIS